MKSDPKSAPLSTAAQYILLALAGQDLHGYGIIQEVSRLTENTYRIGPGTLYDNLKKLMDAKLVIDAPRTRQSKAAEDDRRFYRITATGQSVLAAEVARLETIVATHARLRRPRNA